MEDSRSCRRIHREENYEMEELLEILAEIKEDVDFENEENLVNGGILNSLDVLQIIAAINEEYDISIPAKEIIPDNFNSAKRMWAMVERLMDD